MAKGRTNVRKSSKGRRNKRSKGALTSIVLHTRGFSTSISATSNLATGAIPIDCRVGGVCFGTSGANIANLYSEYKTLTLHLKFISAVGPGAAAAGGRGYFAYNDNPEYMTQWAAATDATRIVAIKNMGNMFEFPVWKSASWKVPLTMRRKTFDVNFNNDSSIDVQDRSTQGYIFFAFETIGATDTVGAIQTTGKLWLNELQPNLGS